MLPKFGDKSTMFALTSAYQRCRSRLRKDDLGVTLWGYLCAVLFLIAMTISLLGCAGAPFAPRLEGTMLGSAASSASASETGGTMGGAPGASPFASLTVRF
jgi:hypothetical protein